MRLLTILLCASVALAEPRETRLLSVAEDAYAHGFFADALGAFRDAYELTHESSLLLKIGKCLEQLKYPSEAALTYRKYLAVEKNLSAGERASMEARIVVLEAKNRPAPPPIAIAVAPLPPPPPPSHHVIGLRRAVIASAIATAATVLVAGGLSIGAADAYAQLNNDCRQLSSGCNDGASNRLSLINHSADAMWSIAALGAAATLTLHLVLRHQKQLR